MNYQTKHKFYLFSFQSHTFFYDENFVMIWLNFKFNILISFEEMLCKKFYVSNTVLNIMSLFPWIFTENVFICIFLILESIIEINERKIKIIKVKDIYVMPNILLICDIIFVVSLNKLKFFTSALERSHLLT